MNDTNAEGTLEVAASWGGPGGGWAVLVHGGAGEIHADRVGAHVAGCREAAEVAADLLRAGASALDAVERAVSMLEDNPVFNAGVGACLNEDGLIELDASLMEGGRLRAGGVCALPPFLHPIEIARAALEDGRHVLYAGDGAARFARENGFVPVTTDAMTTEGARRRWLAARAAAVESGRMAGGGTVGAVALDGRGLVAAATSTGGLVNKRAGRVGDSPLIGAGTYADNTSGACSCTGHGESIMRLVLAKSATDALRAGQAPEEAARAAIHDLGTKVGGTGGIIVVDRTGRLALARNTPAMTWAAAGAALAMSSGV